MSKKLFVGGLNWNTTDEGLRQAFDKFGTIEEVKVITDRQTGRSRGFGFVTFAQDNDAVNAISEMNGKELEGRTIKVNEAEQREARPQRPGGGRGFDRGRGRRDESDR